MNPRTRFRRLVAAPQRGFSLTELVVTVVVTAILLVMIGSLFVQTGKITNNANIDRLSATQSGNILDAIETPVRTATAVAISGGSSPAVQEAKASSFTVISMTGIGIDATAPQPATKYQFSVTASGDLTVTSCGVSVSSSGIYDPSSCTSPRTQIAGSGITGGSISTYLDASGNEFAFDGTGKVATASLPNIAAISVNASVLARAGRPPVVIATTINMTNLGLSSAS